MTFLTRAMRKTCLGLYRGRYWANMFYVLTHRVSSHLHFSGFFLFSNKKKWPLSGHITIQEVAEEEEGALLHPLTLRLAQSLDLWPSSTCNQFIDLQPIFYLKRSDADGSTLRATQEETGSRSRTQEINRYRWKGRGGERDGGVAPSPIPNFSTPGSKWKVPEPSQKHKDCKDGRHLSRTFTLRLQATHPHFRPHTYTHTNKHTQTPPLNNSGACRVWTSQFTEQRYSTQTS